MTAPRGAAIRALAELVEEAHTEQHVLCIDDDGWALQHPTACLPDLLSCALHKRATGDPDAVWIAVSELGDGNYWAMLGTDGDIEIDSTPVPKYTAATQLKALTPTLARQVQALWEALDRVEAAGGDIVYDHSEEAFQRLIVERSRARAALAATEAALAELGLS